MKDFFLQTSNFCLTLYLTWSVDNLTHNMILYQKVSTLAVILKLWSVCICDGIILQILGLNINICAAGPGHGHQHYSDVIMSAIASQITDVSIVVQPFVQAQIKGNIKVLGHWPLWGESTGDRWIPFIKGQWRRKCFHLMTSHQCACRCPSWSINRPDAGCKIKTNL